MQNFCLAKQKGRSVELLLPLGGSRAFASLPPFESVVACPRYGKNLCRHAAKQRRLAANRPIKSLEKTPYKTTINQLYL